MNLLRSKLRALRLYKAQLGWIGLASYIMDRLRVGQGKLIRVRLNNGKSLYLRNKTYDTIIFSQIFIYQDLNFSVAESPKIIIDCGANIGLSTLYFKFRYPDATIISVEPESSNFTLLTKNTASFADIFLINKGVWNKSCELFIIDEGEGHASFRVSEIDPRKNVIGKVQAISIKDILETFDLSCVDLLKMDIEGSEYNCFDADAGAWLNKTRCIAIEIHEHMHPGCKDLIDRSIGNRTYERNGEYHVYSNILN